MKYIIAVIGIFSMSGCVRNENLIGNEAKSGAADNGAAQAPIPPKSETLKVTYSNSDSYVPSKPPKKETAPSGTIDENAVHETKEKPMPKKSEHEGHQPK